MNNVYHLAGTYVMVVTTKGTFVRIAEILVKHLHGLAKKHLGIGRDGAVRVQFDENPIGTALDTNVEPGPEAKAVRTRSGIFSEIGIFYARKDAEFSGLEIQSKRTLNHQEGTGIGRGTGGRLKRFASNDRVTAVVRLGLRRIYCVVDAIDSPGLSRVWSRGHGEIGKAATLREDGNLIGNTAVSALWIGVVEAPVTVDKSIAESTGFIFAQKAVAVEVFFSFFKGAFQVFPGVVVVVKVNFYFAPGSPAKNCQLAYDVFVILLYGIKETVLGGETVAVAIALRYFRKSGFPQLHTLHGAKLVCVVERLEMITNSYDEVFWTYRFRLLSKAPHVGKISGQPEIKRLIHYTSAGL